MANYQVYQLKVTLANFQPPIWRRLLVTENTTLAALHHILQTAIGWTNSHLHQFIIDGVLYSDPRFGLGEFDPVENEHDHTLASLALREATKFSYEYDFGDSWRHTIIVEQILTADQARELSPERLPVCLRGKRACPPEDIGGVLGFEEFLHAINDPTHPNHEEMVDWYGADQFDLNDFDPAAVNHLLRR